MDSHLIAEQMKLNAHRIRALVEGVSEEQAHWKPEVDTWSILEVICHLYDEEREDFRLRLEITLAHPELAWPPIDPEGWVTSRKYNQRQLGPTLLGFLDERTRSLAWLGSLGAPRWEATYKASFGLIAAGDLLASWAAHDLLHMRQLVELQHLTIARFARPYDLDYAGSW